MSQTELLADIVKYSMKVGQLLQCMPITKDNFYSNKFDYGNSLVELIDAQWKYKKQFEVYIPLPDEIDTMISQLWDIGYYLEDANFHTLHGAVESYIKLQDNEVCKKARDDAKAQAALSSAAPKVTSSEQCAEQPTIKEYTPQQYVSEMMEYCLNIGKHPISNPITNDDLGCEWFQNLENLLCVVLDYHRLTKTLLTLPNYIENLLEQLYPFEDVLTDLNFHSFNSWLNEYHKLTKGTWR
jgi:hypothetical protein